MLYCILFCSMIYTHILCWFRFCFLCLHPSSRWDWRHYVLGWLSVCAYVCVFIQRHSSASLQSNSGFVFLHYFFTIVSLLVSGFVFLWILVFCILLCFAVKIFSGRQSSIDRLMGGTLNPTHLLHSKCVFVALDCRKLHCWWCLHSMQCRIYLTVRCLSVCLSHR